MAQQPQQIGGSEIDPNCVKDPIVTDAKDYEPKGDIITAPQLYIVNKPNQNDKNANKGIILLIYDVWGWNKRNKSSFSSFFCHNITMLLQNQLSHYNSDNIAFMVFAVYIEMYFVLLIKLPNRQNVV